MPGLGRASWSLSTFNDLYVLKFSSPVCPYRPSSRLVINLILPLLENGNDDNSCHPLKRKNVEHFLKSLTGIYTFPHLIDLHFTDKETETVKLTKMQFESRQF